MPDLLAISEALPDRFPFLLESAAQGGLSEYSLLLYARGEALVKHPGEAPRGPGSGPSFLERLERWYQEERTDHPVGPLPFAGGWFVFLGYEMAREIEPSLNLPPNRSELPEAVAQRCPGAVIVRHGGSEAAPDRAYVVGESAEVRDEILACLQSFGELRRIVPSRPAPMLMELLEDDPSWFENAVQRVHQYLAAGDVFQVNLSRAWAAFFSAEPDPCELYRALRHTNPAPFAGLMNWAGQTLLSSSPERLVQLRGRRLQTRPIAGTRPRGRDARQDQALSSELINNLKERAEHVMLIDLERNDLGRVCRPGSIEVNELMVVETYAHVHHIVSNVRGELRPDASPIDAIRAVFPGGTITGCPKVRCMEIIAELEQDGRGFYTGSMGYLGRDGGMDLNILIRSMIVDGRRVGFRTGAGIVADSVAEQEVIETADKARGLLLAVESHGRKRKHA